MSTYRNHTIEIVKGKYEFSVYPVSPTNEVFPVLYVSVAYGEEHAETVGRCFVDSVIAERGGR